MAILERIQLGLDAAGVRVFQKGGNTLLTTTELCHGGASQDKLAISGVNDEQFLAYCYSQECGRGSDQRRLQDIILDKAGLPKRQRQVGGRNRKDSLIALYDHPDGVEREVHRLEYPADFEAGIPCPYSNVERRNGQLSRVPCGQLDPHKHVWGKGKTAGCYIKLWGLDRPDNLLVVVEGEKAAKALLNHEGVTPVSWRGGEKNARYAVWGKVKGRRVAFWPDNDDAGERAMEDAGRECLAAEAAELLLIPYQDMPEKGDAADCSKAEQARRISEAKPWEPPEPEPEIADLPHYLRPAHHGDADSDAARLAHYMPERFLVEQQKSPRVLFQAGMGLWSDMGEKTWGETSGGLKKAVLECREKAAAELVGMKNAGAAYDMKQGPRSKAHYEAVKASLDTVFRTGEHAAEIIWPSDVGHYHARPALPLAQGGGLLLDKGRETPAELARRHFPDGMFRVKEPPAQASGEMDSAGAQAARAFLDPFRPVIDRLGWLMAYQDKSVDSIIVPETNRGKSTLAALLCRAMGTPFIHFPQTPPLRTTGGFTTLTPALAQGLAVLLDEADRLETPGGKLSVTQVDGLLSEFVDVHVKNQMPAIQRRIAAAVFLGNALPPFDLLDRGMCDMDGQGNPIGRVNRCVLLLEGLPYVTPEERQVLLTDGGAADYCYALLLETAERHWRRGRDFRGNCWPETAAALQAGDGLIARLREAAEASIGELSAEGGVSDPHGIDRVFVVTGNPEDLVPADDLRQIFTNARTREFGKAWIEWRERHGVESVVKANAEKKRQTFWVGIKRRREYEAAVSAEEE